MRARHVQLRAAALTAIALSAGCAADAARPALELRAQGLVYGDDDRTEYHAAGEAWLRERIAQSTVALVDQRLLSADETGAARFAPESNAELNGLCPDEPFADQPSLAQCSGVLIDRQLVLTAAHCLRELPCAQWKALFGFYYRAPLQLNELRASDVYSCSHVVAMDYSWAPDGGADYAIFALDRPVDALRVPAALDPRDRPARLGARMIAIGHGAGIPAKLDAGGLVADARAATLDYFVSNVDGFHGGSGSGVYDELGNLRGVLASGGEDYEETPEGCRRVRRVSAEPNLARERTTYLARALEGLCATAPEHSLCADSAPVPRGCAVRAPGQRPRSEGATWPFALASAWLVRSARRRRRVQPTLIRFARASQPREQLGLFRRELFIGQDAARPEITQLLDRSDDVRAAGPAVLGARHGG